MSFDEKPGARAEHRWPAVIALLLALGLYATLPSSFLPALRYAVVAVGLLMLIPLIGLNPARLRRQTRWSKDLGPPARRLPLSAGRGPRRRRGAPPEIYVFSECAAAWRQTHCSPTETECDA